MYITGGLRIENKIWFNDALRNRLRICGFTKTQIEKLRNAKLVDITLLDCKEDDIECKAYVDISELTEDDKKEYKKYGKNPESWNEIFSVYRKSIVDSFNRYPEIFSVVTEKDSKEVPYEVYDIAKPTEDILGESKRSDALNVYIALPKMRTLYRDYLKANNIRYPNMEEVIITETIVGVHIFADDMETYENGVPIKIEFPIRSKLEELYKLLDMLHRSDMLENIGGLCIDEIDRIDDDEKAHFRISIDTSFGYLDKIVDEIVKYYNVTSFVE